MAAPIGNTNAAKAKVWADAIRYALAERERENKPGAVRDLASKLIDNALAGDMAALKELGDRLDGKPAQTISGDPDAPLVSNLKLIIEPVPSPGA